MSDLFKEKAKDWDKNDRARGLSNAVGAAIMEQVTVNESMRVMDFGAGTGLISQQLAPCVKQIVAVDTSESMLDKLLSKDDLKNKVTTLCKNILEEPFDDQFDLVVSAMAMHHVEDTSKLFRRFAKVLSSGAMVALADLDKEDGSFHPKGTEGVYHNGFDREALAEKLTQAGFEDVQFVTAYTFKGKEREFPLFLVTARKR